MQILEKIFYSFGFLYGLYIVSASIALAILIYLHVRKIHIRKYEYLTLILPFAIWSSLMLNNITPKSLSNFIEAPLVGAIVSVLAVLRYFLRNKIHNISPIFLGSSCLSAIIIYFAVPGLAE